jgi:A/G-specific adenine glycosylase
MNNKYNYKLDFSVETLRNDLIQWWKQHGRRFPWRETENPYNILIAEVLLHRTKASQVIPVYKLLISKFPDIVTITEINENELLEILYSIGLRWRSKLLYTMLKQIVVDYNGIIPEDFNKLVSLPGINHYIASALRCFAFGYPDVLMDTNTVRITGRIIGLAVNDGSRRSNTFRNILELLIDKQRPREFNWALIDLAAIVCKVRQPNHNDCPLKNYCHMFIKEVK